MKKLLVALVLSIGTITFAQEKKMGPPEGNAMAGEIYGAEVSAGALENAITAKQLEKKLKKNSKIENVVIRGTVTEVCDKKGCWLTVKTNSKNRFFVKMKDYAFFVPLALKGKEVLLEGDAELKMTSVKDLKHYAEDAKKSKEEIALITQPSQEVNFMASSIKVIN